MNEEMMLEDESLSEEDQRLMLEEQLQVFGSRLSRLVSEQSGLRSEIEARWLEDLRQYHGEYTADELSRMTNGSSVFVNITRNKTNGAEARLGEMLFPTDDRNWGVRPTPVPELSNVKPGQVGVDPATGQPIDLGKLADQIEKQAADQAMLMEKEIDDQLTEAKYNAKSRDVIHDACQLGTGIIKGPVIVGKIKKRWDVLQDGTSVLQVEEALEPSAERVDPWDFFPDMSARRLDECEFIFERRRMSKRQLREFARLPGVMIDQVRRVAESKAQSTHLTKDYIADIREITGVNTVSSSTLYEVWEYHGPVSKDELQTTGLFADEEIDELNDEVDAIVHFSGNHVLKVTLNPLETEERPYAVFNWEKDESCVFGFGVPYLMRNAQKVINASWRMMMDNAGASVADTTIVNRELVTPADGSWGFGPKKMYFLKDKSRDVREAFASFSQPSHQVELANIFSMARQLADEETNLPLIAQGEQSSHVTKTSSGMEMLMNSANIVLRRAIKNWDDDVTAPTIKRFYDWNMQFSDKAEIKGDYCIDARGTGALLVKDKQQENLMLLAGISAQNPEFAIRVDWDGLYKEIVKSLEVPAYNVTLTDAEVEDKRQQMMQQAQAQQEQPDNSAAQVKMAELQLKQQQMQIDMQVQQARMQYDMQLQQAKLEQERELKFADLALREQITMAELQSRLQIESQKDKTARDRAAADTAIKRMQKELKAQNLQMGFDTYG
jgi:hypothetical protein